MTEDEARLKWCPFTRLVAAVEGVAFAGQSAYNRHSDAASHEVFIPSAGCCIASQCMAWRWEYRKGVESGEIFKSTLSGYCGLAATLVD